MSPKVDAFKNYQKITESSSGSLCCLRAAVFQLGASECPCLDWKGIEPGLKSLSKGFFVLPY